MIQDRFVEVDFLERTPRNGETGKVAVFDGTLRQFPAAAPRAIVKTSKVGKYGTFLFGER